MSDHRDTAHTRLLHADRLGGAEHGAIHKPIHTSVQWGFERTADLIGVFQGTVKNAYNYGRQGTPTTAALEAKITLLEQGVGSISFATGMAALAAIWFTLLKAGDHLVASKHVFGNTNRLLGTKVDASQADGVRAALRPHTRMVFVETIANPGTQVPDLAGIGRLCAERGLLYVVDNTVTSPALFQPRTVGAGLVLNSLTKTVAGHGHALGGAVTDTGLFDWRAYPNISAGYRNGDAGGWGLQQIRKKGLRDMGGSLSSDAAHRIAVGAETLSLRVQHTSRTALALARLLAAHPAVSRVRYPFLDSHPQHERAQALFAAGSWLLSFELRDASRMLAVLDALRLCVKATGLGDTRTLVIPVAPTIFWEAGPQVRADMDIADGLVRVSIGLEDPADLLHDFEQALRLAG
jgi:O-acetylhomoserine (thiol)-lyase